MNTQTKTLDTQELEARVKEMYREVAEEPHNDFHFETGRELAERLGYPADQLDAIPAQSIDSFAGVGYYFDLADIKSGETIIDLGSGSGTDSFLAARHTGDSGKVIGIDMTDAQIEKSRRLASADGFDNTEFRQGYIEQEIAEPGSADVVISNGVVNLSPDKDAVFGAAARALKPGGRLALSDIVSGVPLPEGVTCDAALWAACIGGAMLLDDYAAAIENAGFKVVTVRDNDRYRFLSERADSATSKYQVKSVSILAERV